MVFDTQQHAYLSLRNIVAERTRPLIVWVGAGLSAEAGLPSWAGLQANLLEALYRRAFSMDPSDAEHLTRQADEIKREENPWTAFGRLQVALGKTTYRDMVRDALKLAVTVEVPEVYRLLWRLPISGVLTLNLDRMAVRAYGAENPGYAPVEFAGRQVGALVPNMHGERRFIVNLHGNMEDSSSWIFTRDELRDLSRKREYKEFLRLCLLSFTNLFVGITADDIAVGAHLEALSKLPIQSHSHFWITARRDLGTDSWAEAAGVRLIRYPAINNDHSAVKEALRDLLAAAPTEPPPAPPVAFSGPVAPEVPPLLPPDQMITLSSEEIRLRLNGEAMRILADGDEESYLRYEEFVQEYDEVIFRAWYTSARPGRNKLLGYTLKEQVATGAFGRVYRAEAPDGREVAVKVLLEEVRRDPSLLRSFRRGVRSMQILNKSDVEGMVAYETASEIPAFVTMEWIDGPNLAQAKASSQLEDWAEVLDIGRSLAAIIRNAHALPSRVLHRDIRPANVMLEGYWSNAGQYKVVVLDFDLSWHRGAQELSVVHTTAVGYLAPEQILEAHDGSTRNAAVDVFGLGMTMYFLCGGKEPMPEFHRHVDYEKLVMNATRSLKQSSWLSLPRRMTRLILSATRDRQNERWDLSQMFAEMDRLHDVHTGQVDRATPAMVAEELAARTEQLAQYGWEADSNAATRTVPTGLSLQISADEPNLMIGLTVSWRSTGREQRVGMNKFVSRSTRDLGSKLKAAGWRVVSERSESQAMQLRATREYVKLRSDLTGEGSKLSRALDGLKFSV